MTEDQGRAGLETGVCQEGLIRLQVSWTRGRDVGESNGESRGCEVVWLTWGGRCEAHAPPSRRTLGGQRP
jgi:hypothetical protein